jgi:hypothetical protein
MLHEQKYSDDNNDGSGGGGGGGSTAADKYIFLLSFHRSDKIS